MKLNVGYLEFHVRVGDSDCRIVVHVDEINAICEAPKHDSPYAKARTHLFTNGSDEPYALTDQYETVVERYMNEKDRLAKPREEDDKRTSLQGSAPPSRWYGASSASRRRRSRSSASRTDTTRSA